MGPTLEEVTYIILRAFPNLSSDKYFKVTSKNTPVYNCIAWAYNITDRWMWPNTGENYFLDGVHYWPSDKIMDCDVQNFIDAFRLKGYELCEDGVFEEGFRKIALYVVPNTTECRHAARQLSNGCWTSKLGRLNDIQHGTPESIEGTEYGIVYCFMKRKFE
ncbi:MAG TPA: hypothetical protein DER56_03425 [Thermosipho africanus]|jgi:hypothetical protein|nr:hypothetical protein [Thermosipho africanus]